MIGASIPSSFIFKDLTSVPGWRETLRAETNPLFKGLKSLSHEYVKLWSVWRCSSAVSLKGFGLQQEKYRGLGHAIDRPIPGVKSRFSCSPLLHHGDPPVSEFWGHHMKVLSRKNKALNFKDTKHKETCMPSLSGQIAGHNIRQAF